MITVMFNARARKDCRMDLGKWRAKAAQVYPDRLCQACTKGVKYMLNGDRKAEGTSHPRSAGARDL